MNINQTELELNEIETRYLCHGLLYLAATDEIHANEKAMIDEFYRSTPHGDTQLPELSPDTFDLMKAVEVLQGDRRDAFFVSCFMLIYADGHYSEAERTCMASFADAFGLKSGELERYHSMAKTQILDMFSAEFRNPEAVDMASSELETTSQLLNSENT